MFLTGRDHKHSVDLGLEGASLSASGLVGIRRAALSARAHQLGTSARPLSVQESGGEDSRFLGV